MSYKKSGITQASCLNISVRSARSDTNMRLLNVEAPELELKEFFGDMIPPCAILSHTWGDDEVAFQDLQHGRYEHKAGFRKIHYACRQAKQDGLSWC